MAIKYTNIYHSKALQNLPKFGIFGLKTNHLATLFLRWSSWALFADGVFLESTLSSIRAIDFFKWIFFLFSFQGPLLLQLQSFLPQSQPADQKILIRLQAGTDPIKFYTLQVYHIFLTCVLLQVEAIFVPLGS
jgi:hypothetical protein